jgi:hypothetical protein
VSGADVVAAFEEVVERAADVASLGSIQLNLLRFWIGVASNAHLRVLWKVGAPNFVPNFLVVADALQSLHSFLTLKPGGEFDRGVLSSGCSRWRYYAVVELRRQLGREGWERSSWARRKARVGRRKKALSWRRTR